MRPPHSPVAIVTLNGAQLAYQQFGGDESPVVILVSGNASSMDWWDEGFCELLAAGNIATGPRRVIRYDLRDTGQSETVAPGAARYTGEDLINDLAALIEYLQASPAHVVGLSMGGALVQQLALVRPEVLASITLMSTTPIGDVTTALPPPSDPLAASWVKPPPQVDWADPDSVGAAAVDSEQLYSGSIPIDASRIRGISAIARSRTTSPLSANNHLSLSDGPELRTDISSISIPTLVIHGSDDPLFPLPHGEMLAQLIPAARLVVVPGLGHQFPPPPAWSQIADAILEHTASPAQSG
jgi:pimeloyl-ACP methyl ester carboxylesterase